MLDSDLGDRCFVLVVEADPNEMDKAKSAMEKFGCVPIPVADFQDFGEKIKHFRKEFCPSELNCSELFLGVIANLEFPGRFEPGLPENAPRPYGVAALVRSMDCGVPCVVLGDDWQDWLHEATKRLPLGPDYKYIASSDGKRWERAVEALIRCVLRKGLQAFAANATNQD